MRTGFLLFHCAFLKILVAIVENFSENSSETMSETEEKTDTRSIVSTEMSASLAEIGRQLVESSFHPEPGERGVVTQLFPYMFEAYKRISARAISRELEKRGVKLSQVSISKALRHPTPHFIAHFDHIEPAARTIRRNMGISVMSLLTDENSFQEAELACEKHHFVDDDPRPVWEAMSILRNEWWFLSDDFRQQCLKGGEFEEEEESEDEWEPR